MSGHSKWSTIKRQKGANDAKRGAIFTKIGNQIAIAARAGVDPALNSNLAIAIEKAKAVNMPMSNIQRAIDRVADKNALQLEEVTYEGYGPGGVAIIVEAATDNKNRTFPEVKHVFTRHGGSVAEPGSVLFQFTRKGIIKAEFTGDPDEALLITLDAGAEDATVEDNLIAIYTNPKSLQSTLESLKTIANFKILEAELGYEPNNLLELASPEQEQKIMNLIDTLDELDDVVSVYSNI
jgi:YebC/PmpR family DNA-binding regulatory protein